ncbi:MAG: VWA-like domain-containing protein [Candidatus Goldbacteria bacterium]|nr:VWA-like domain-containing protein [Candidatus Goldiibacteriota bacterium]
MFNEKSIENKIKLIKTLMLAHYPFYGKFLLNVDIIPRPSISTLATDSYNIYYNPDFVLKEPFNNIFTCFLHEILHIMLQHFIRFNVKDFSKRGLGLILNIALDYAVNSLIFDSILLEGNKLRPGQNFISSLYYSSKYKFKNVEFILQDLLKEISIEKVKYYQNSEEGEEGGEERGNGGGGEEGGGNKKEKGGGKGEKKKEGGKGEGGGSEEEGGEKGEGEEGKEGEGEEKGEELPNYQELTNGRILDDHNYAWDSVKKIKKFKNKIDEIKDKINDITQKSYVSSPNTMGFGETEDAVKLYSFLNPSLGKLNWKQYIEKNIISYFGDIELDISTFDKRYVSRERFIYPYRYQRNAYIIIAVDTSGSITKDMLNIFVGEIYGVLKQIKNLNILFYACDDSIRKKIFYKNIGDFRNNVKSLMQNLLHGGGNTSFVPVFKDLEQNRKKHFKRDDKLLMFYFTDGFGDQENVNIPLFLKNKVFWIIPKQSTQDVIERFPKHSRCIKIDI